MFAEDPGPFAATAVRKIMKRFLALLVVAAASFQQLVQAADTSAGKTNAQPRYPVTLICFNGKVDSGSSCGETPQASKHDENVKITHGLTCGLPGKVSEIKWEFVGYQGPADVYRVSRRFPADKPGAVTVTNWTVYYGKRVAVFQDQDQVIVVEPPKKKE